MQTFRAFLQDASGAITWASWVEAVDLAEARQAAQALCVGQSPSVDPWFATERLPAAGSVLEPV